MYVIFTDCGLYPYTVESIEEAKNLICLNGCYVEGEIFKCESVMTFENIWDEETGWTEKYNFKPTNQTSFFSKEPQWLLFLFTNDAWKARNVKTTRQKKRPRRVFF